MHWDLKEKEKESKLDDFIDRHNRPKKIKPKWLTDREYQSSNSIIFN